jgi:hypothetical protein
VAIDLPVVGVLSHASLHNKVAWGYTLGAGLSWEVTPSWLVRLAASHGGASFGTARIAYLNAGTRVEDAESAVWSGTLMRLGVAYEGLRELTPGAFPYIGADVAIGRGGYTYTYDSAAKKLELPSPTNAPAAEHTAVDWLFGAGGRAGVRLQLDRCLSTQSEVAAVYLPFATPSVSGNIESRDVRAAPASAVLMQATFSVRVCF